MFVVDRFEGEWAVVENENRRTFNIPKSILPIGIKEGDVINIQVTIDLKATKVLTEKSKHLLDNFFDE